MLKNATPASPATARASRVFPVPGGPYNKTPFGIFAPISLNFFGAFRNSTISCSSSLTSSAPATSLKVTLFFSSMVTLALLLLNCITLPPPPWLCCMIKKNSPTIRISGSSVPSRLIHGDGCGVSFWSITTKFSCMMVSVSSAFSRGMITPLNTLPSVNSPFTV